MAQRALLDLRLLLRLGGAAVAASTPYWSTCGRATRPGWSLLCRWRHRDDALSVLKFLQGVQSQDGTREAILLTGDGPVADGRAAQLDANGWVPWAVWTWYVSGRSRSRCWTGPRWPACGPWCAGRPTRRRDRLASADSRPRPRLLGVPHRSGSRSGRPHPYWSAYVLPLLSRRCWGTTATQHAGRRRRAGSTRASQAPSRRWATCGTRTGQRCPSLR